MMRKVGMVIFILLFLILFVFLGLGSSRVWYERGTGYSIYEQLDTAAVRKARFKDILDPIEGNALTEYVYGAARIAPAIVWGYWSAIPMAFEAMSAGITNEEVLQKESNRAIIDNAKKHASRYGLMYATLMVNGVHIPLFGLILVTAGIVVEFGSKKTQRCLIIAIPLLCLWGMIYLAIAERMVTSIPTSFLVLLGSAFIIWFIIGILFGFIILVVSLMRYFFHKTKKLKLN